MMIIKKGLKVKLRTLFCALWALSVAPLAWGEDAVIWPHFDSPPHIILDGDYQGQGSTDSIIRFYQKNLPQYTHVDTEMNFKRFFQYVEDRTKTVCAIGADKTPERLELLYYAPPTTIELAVTVVIKKSRWDDFGNTHTVSLEKVLQDPDSDGMFIRGRSYTAEADALLEKYGDDPHVQIKPITEDRMFKMLLAERIDYIVLAPSVANYLAEQSNAKVVSMEIEEIQPYTLGYTVCNKTETGKKIIQNISDILHQQRANPEYLAMLTKWQDDNSRQRIKKIYTEDLLERME